MAAWLSRSAADAREFVLAHRRMLSTSLLVSLAGFGVAAFGIAPLAPDAAELPHRLITETVTPTALQGQLEALAVHPMALSRSTTTRPSDTADALLRRLGVSDPSAADWLRRDEVARRVVDGRTGKLVSATLNERGVLQQLVARYPSDLPATTAAPKQFNRLTLRRDADGSWHSLLESAPLLATPRLASGSIRSSLFAATDDAGIPDAIAVQMAEMFSTEIDFHRELRKGDSFSVVYEALTADGEPINWSQGTGRVLAAEFVNNGKAHQAVWFGEGRGGYFDFNGQSKQRSFLASPMEFSRVTSGFAMRFHPIQQKWRAHLGVDYGAPTGTAVRCVGAGVVSFAGRQNGYGNVVEVQHSGDRKTVYAHLSRVDVRVGQHIEQAQRLGAVGATGWATGPHLHFEFRVHGQHADPLAIAKASETLTLDTLQRPRFAQVALQMKSELDLAETLTGQPGRVE
ncbi:MAG: M23 family metallopeptidase [Vitreoscilla sp.]|nr:M23 family metallopeptidase [Vitreoscilla sp.]